MKFSATKHAKFCPGFIYPPDEDGQSRAQGINSAGYPTSTKNIFFEFTENLPQKKKKSTEILALDKLNEKFKFNFH